MKMIKTAKEILWDNLTFMYEDTPEWRLDDVLKSMEEYAKQAIDKCAEEVRLSTGWISYEDTNYPYDSIEVDKDSILNVKKLLK